MLYFQVYPLLEEIKHALWRNSEDSPANSVLILPTAHSSSNVLCVKSVMDSISVNVIRLFPLVSQKFTKHNGQVLYFFLQLRFSGIFTRETAYSFSFEQNHFEILNLVMSSTKLVESGQVTSGDVLIAKVTYEIYQLFK